MNRPAASQADRRVPIALSVLAAILALLGAHQMAFRGASPAEGQRVQMASTTASSPAR